MNSDETAILSHGGGASTHINGLSPAEAERLELLKEECAEVIQAACKVARHGYESHNPLIAAVSPSNREALEVELGHLQHAVGLMMAAADVSALGIAGSAKLKAERIGRWLHHQPEGLSGPGEGA